MEKDKEEEKKESRDITGIIKRQEHQAREKEWYIDFLNVGPNDDKDLVLHSILFIRLISLQK